MTLNRFGQPLNKDTSYTVGGTLTEGVIHLDGEGEDVKCFKIEDNLDLWSGIYLEHDEKLQDNTLHDINSEGPQNSIGKLLDQHATTIPIVREKSNSFLKVNPANPNSPPKVPMFNLPSTELKSHSSGSKGVSNHDITKLLMDNHRFSVIDGNLHCWNQALKYHVGLVGDKADLFIRQNIPDRLKRFISSRNCEEIVKWLKANEQLQISKDVLTKRKDYVAFSNCVIRISDMSIHQPSPDFYFTGVTNADFPIHSHPSGHHLESLMRWVSGGNRAIYNRIQELFGYVLSEIRDVKIIAFLLGPKDSGKSIVLKLLECLVGDEFCTNLSFEEMNQQQTLCHLFEKKLNCCGEISEVPLNRLDMIKKLSGGDYVMARFLYGQAFKFINKAALVFAGNHLPVLKGIDRTNAFSERLAIFPFFHQVSKKKQDIHLLDKLLQEKSYIAKWSLIGLRRWCQNNYQFTSCEEIAELSSTYADHNNSIKSFVNDSCILDQDFRTHNHVLETAYRKYCRENGMIEETDKAFHKYMQGIKGLKHARFRLNHVNKFGYIGIALHSTQNEEGEAFETGR